MDLLLSISTASYCTRCGEVCFMHTSIAVPFEYSIHAHTEDTVTSVTCIICTLTRGVRYEWHVYRVWMTLHDVTRIHATTLEGRSGTRVYVCVCLCEQFGDSSFHSFCVCVSLSQRCGCSDNIVSGRLWWSNRLCVRLLVYKCPMHDCILYSNVVCIWIIFFSFRSKSSFVVLVALSSYQTPHGRNPQIL